MTNPFNMASLFGVGILQFIGMSRVEGEVLRIMLLGMQAVWLLLMAASSLVKRKKRSSFNLEDFPIENLITLFEWED